jgi:hypothetical protein
MRVAVDFNTKFQFRTIKVNDKPYNWMLASELETKIAIS